MPCPALPLLLLFSSLLPPSYGAPAPIDRPSLVHAYNPTRTSSSPLTPLQVGNGNFAFGTDVTGLQTFIPYAIMSSWGWHNDSLPAGYVPADYHGVDWPTHGREVAYDIPDPGLPELSQWLIANPNRMNLGRVGLLFDGNVTEDELVSKTQTLDLWSGVMTSSFVYDSETVEVQTSCHPTNDTVAVQITSNLVSQGKLGIYLDFPYHNGLSKFEAPLVGIWNATANHTTQLSLLSNSSATIYHTLDSTSYFTTIAWPDSVAVNLTRDDPSAHRYSIVPLTHGSVFSFTVAYTSTLASDAVLDVPTVVNASAEYWADFWTTGGFVDVVTGSTDPRASELQRRIILSSYNLAVNEAGKNPPQESGLVNNGWYGKFHMEMFFWHSSHWALWNKWSLLNRSTPTYADFLSTSIQRAHVQQGYPSPYGARWPKMTDPSGRTSPGEINTLLIWQQPHPLFFAELEYRASPNANTTSKWDAVVRATAEFMAEFAWWNETTGVYDLGPPMYPVSENTVPNVTMNTAFELSYWRWGLETAMRWVERQGERAPRKWARVAHNLAPLPTYNGTYLIYEGIGDMWTNPAYTDDHPELVGLYGWLPQTDKLDIATANRTTLEVYNTWNFTDCWGWDFPMLAMSAARLGNRTHAVDWLLDPLFTFDDAGMPGGGVQVPTPYFPGAGGLLYAVAFMAAGWDGAPNTTAPGFPVTGWVVRHEGLSRAI